MQCSAGSGAGAGAVQCSAVQVQVQCSAVAGAVQCSAVQCSAVQCSAVQCSAVQCSVQQFHGNTLQQQHLNLFSQTFFLKIYENEQFSHFIDGSDEEASSWMRFIRCARNKSEQNMGAFQYGQNIYYRALRDIPVSEEILVWYDHTYTQFWGVPLALNSEIKVREEGKIDETCLS